MQFSSSKKKRVISTIFNDNGTGGKGNRVEAKTSPRFPRTSKKRNRRGEINLAAHILLKFPRNIPYVAAVMKCVLLYFSC